MGFCKSCGAQVDDDAKFCQGCGTPVEQTAAAAPSVVPGVTAPSAPKKSKAGLIIGLVIAAVLVLGVLGGGLAFAISKGYGWLPDNLTRKARAEAALEVVEAFTTGDFRELVDLSTGEMSDVLDEYLAENDNQEPRDVTVGRKKWDGKELTCVIGIEDEIQHVIIEPDDSSTDVRVVVEGENGSLEIELAYDEGWKTTEVSFDGTSFVERLSSETGSSESSSDSEYEDEEYSEESDSAYSNAEERACFSNQRTVEGAFQAALANGEVTASELSGTVDEGHYLVGDYIKNAPTCPTTEDYYYVYDDGEVEDCPEHGHF